VCVVAEWSNKTADQSGNKKSQKLTKNNNNNNKKKDHSVFRMRRGCPGELAITPYGCRATGDYEPRYIRWDSDDLSSSDECSRALPKRHCNGFASFHMNNNPTTTTTLK